MKLYTPSGGRQETKLDSNNFVEFLNHLNIFYGHGSSLNKQNISFLKPGFSLRQDQRGNVVNYLPLGNLSISLHLSDWVRGWEWRASVWREVMAGGLSPGPGVQGVHIWGAAVCIVWHGLMSPLRGGAQTGYHGAEASTNIMSALAIKLCAQITIQLSDHQNLQIFTKFYSFPFSVGRTAELWETSLGLQVIIVILIGLPGVPITSSQHNFNSSHPFPGFDWE